MQQKILLFLAGIPLVLLFLLGGCTTNIGGYSSSSTRRLAGEGEFCGGIAAFQCEAGLHCQYDGTYPDAGGTCVR